MEPSTVHEQAAPVICAHELSKRYGRRQAVSGLGFTVEAGQICALLGPNGGGRTSQVRAAVLVSSHQLAEVQHVRAAALCVLTAGLLVGLAVFGWHPFPVIGAPNLHGGERPPVSCRPPATACCAC
ncbi:hypothetical protein ABTY53_30940 [Streptomyces noursei]|uniref:hypothetical protein n=1 Tax=Streptomyces noursei TaxID=1971 RepID=UPI0033240DE4